jgi:hypothetical protein
MKKILYTLFAAVGLMSAVSCSDMLETESNSQLYDPSLSQKTDSVFYAYGILQAMQQLADQYYFQNELRGDLVKTTVYATTDLRAMSNFEADASNKYDSVYQYYQVINNCNYYLKHRKTDLVTGSQYVAMNEYIAVAAIRAWTYLQLVRQYGDVPYVTEPVMTISDINSQQQTTSASVILAEEAAYLEKLKSEWGPEYQSVPTFGKTSVEIGGNGSRSKKIRPSKCFLPINLVLGDLYLENGNYSKSVESYYDYLKYNASETEVKTMVCLNPLMTYDDRKKIVAPSDYYRSLPTSFTSILTWNNIFRSNEAPEDVISYIPMATSMLQGQTTAVPEAFGYMYYETSGGSYYSQHTLNGVYETTDIQVEPSDEFKEMYSNQPFYYEVMPTSTSSLRQISSAPLGDMRFSIVTTGDEPYDDRTYVYKPGLGTFYLYRNSTVFLSIAEAMNRMGYPDAAFAVLKNGLDRSLVNYIDTAYQHQTFDNPRIRVFGKDRYYLSTRAAKMLSGQSDEFNAPNIEFLPKGLSAEQGGGYDASTGLFNSGTLCGIHLHGAGYTIDESDVQSTYNYFTILDEKLNKLAEKYPNTGLKDKIAKYNEQKNVYTSWLNWLYEDQDAALAEIFNKYSKRVISGLTDAEIAAQKTAENTEEQIIDAAIAKMSNTQIAVAVVRQKYPNFAEYYNSEFTNEDRVNAMEDILCDEYALEAAFEGRRFGDLQRMARHKNESGIYGGSFGDSWLYDKLKFKGFKGIWYLPFK